MTSDLNSTRRIAEQFAEVNSADHFDGFDGYMTRKLFQISVDDWRAMETKQRNKYREKAYHQLSSKLGKTKFISRPTLRPMVWSRWRTCFSKENTDFGFFAASWLYGRRDAGLPEEGDL